MLARVIGSAIEAREFRELEVRVGRSGPSGLHIALAELEALDAELRASQHFESSRWEESHTYSFQVDGVAMRTETRFCSETMRVISQTVCKNRLQTHDMPVDAHMAIMARVSLCEEKPVPSPPDVVLPNFVRIRQRASHTYRGSVCTVRYDLTRTWSDGSRTKAEVRQASEAPRCELELELLDASPDAVGASGAPATYHAAAESLLAKVHDVARLVVRSS